jgi:hypothetical protein
VRTAGTRTALAGICDRHQRICLALALWKADLIAENRRRDKHAPEYELVDTGVFAENRYFDV